MIWLLSLGVALAVRVSQCAAEPVAEGGQCVGTQAQEQSEGATSSEQRYQ